MEKVSGAGGAGWAKKKLGFFSRRKLEILSMAAKFAESFIWKIENNFPRYGSQVRAERFWHIRGGGGLRPPETVRKLHDRPVPARDPALRNAICNRVLAARSGIPRTRPHQRNLWDLKKTVN